MKALLDSLSNAEITLVASLLSAVVAAIVSILTTRYTLKHGPNYEEQIKGIRETIGALAQTQ
jgi:TRAP-type C4-dicarboxylate transport system permease small subunit